MLTGTVLEGTRLPLRVWLDVISDWTVSGHRPTASEVAHRHAVDDEAVRMLLRRLDLCFAVLDYPG